MNKRLLLSSLIASTAMAATIKPIPFDASALYCPAGSCQDNGAIGFNPEYNSIIKLPDNENDQSEDLFYTFSKPSSVPATMVGIEEYYTARLNFNEQGYKSFIPYNLQSVDLKSNFSAPKTVNNPQDIIRGKAKQSNPTYSLPIEKLTPNQSGQPKNLSSDDILFNNMRIFGINTNKAVPVRNAIYIDDDHILISSSCPLQQPYYSDSHCTGTPEYAINGIKIQVTSDLFIYPKEYVNDPNGLLYPVDMAELAALVQSKFPSTFASANTPLNLSYPINIGDLDGNGTDDLWLEGGYILLMKLSSDPSRNPNYKAIDIKKLTLKGYPFGPTQISPSFIGNFDKSSDGSIEFTYPSTLPIDKSQWIISNPTTLHFFSITPQVLASGSTIEPTLIESDNFQTTAGFNINGWPNHFGVSSIALGDKLIVASSRNKEGTSLWEVTPDFTLKRNEHILGFDNVLSDWSGPGISQTSTTYPNQINPQSPGALAWSTTGGSWQEITSRPLSNALIPPTWTNATLQARIATNSTESRDYNGNIQVKLIEANGATTWLGQFELINIPGQSYKDYAFKIPYEYINLLFHTGSKISLTLSSGSFNTKNLILDQLRFTNDPTDNGLNGGTPQDCSALPLWHNGSYSLRDVSATARDGKLHHFICTQGPTNSWCASDAYSPSTVYWPQAWQHIGLCQ